MTRDRFCLLVLVLVLSPINQSWAGNGPATAAGASGTGTSGYDYFTPEVTIFGFDHFNSDYEGATGHYGLKGAGIHLLFPLFSSKAQVAGSPQWQFLGLVEFRPESPDISELTTSHTFLKGDVHLDIDFNATAKDSFLFSVGPGFAEDQTTISDLSLRYTGILLGTHAFSDSFALDYGASYSYTFGNAHLLPVLGFRWDITPSLTLAAVIPHSAQLLYIASPTLILGLTAGPDGDRVRFENAGEFARQPAVLELGYSSLRLGGLASFQISHGFSFRAQAGVNTNRHLNFANGNRTFLKRVPSDGGFAEISLIRTF
jgi:hypothetical protein